MCICVVRGSLLLCERATPDTGGVADPRGCMHLAACCDRAEPGCVLTAQTVQ